MELALTRNEKFFITIGVVTIASFLFAFSKMNKKPNDLSRFEARELINYQMARAEEGFSRYSLDGREIEDEIYGVSPLESAKNPNKKTAAKVIAKSPVKPTAPASKRVLAKPVTHVSSISARALSAVSIKAGDQKKLKIEDITLAANSANVNNNNSTASEIDASILFKNKAPESSVKNKKTFSEWRESIFAKPTKETIAEFISAFRRKEISDVEYQAMAQDLIDQNDPNLKGMGLLALRSQPSMASLSQMVHIQNQLPEALQIYIEQAYLAYILPQNIQYLNQALQTQDKILVLKSLSLLSINIPKIKNGDVSGIIDSRHLRDADAYSTSVEMFNQLLPSLAQISSAQVPDLSPLASQVTTMIQATKVAGL